MAVPGQAEVSYAYDALDRLASVTQGSRSVSFAYDAAGRRVSTTMSDGLATDYAYDAAGRLTGITHRMASGPTIGTLLYGYGPAGDLRSRGGTLFQAVLPAAVEGATYDAANRLTRRVAGGVAATPAWDAEGRLAHDGQRAYTWDARGLLSSIPGAMDFAYDALGRRQMLARTDAANQPPRHYRHDGPDPVQTREGAATADLLTGGLDERFARRTSADGLTSAFLTDHLGSTVALADPATGAIRTSYGYDPYGSGTVTGAATDNGFGWAGREADRTGLHYNRARYYHPTWGRFISEDPIDIEGGINLYNYADNDPLRFSDPWGRNPIAGGAVIGGSIGGPLGAVAGGFIGGRIFICGALVDCFPKRPPPPPVTPPASPVYQNAPPQTRPGVGKPMDDDQRAIKDLADEASNGGRRPLSEDEANAVLDWPQEYGYPGAGAEPGDVANPSNWDGGNNVPHIHVPGVGSGHVPVVPGVAPRPGMR